MNRAFRVGEHVMRTGDLHDGRVYVIEDIRYSKVRLRCIDGPPGIPILNSTLSILGQYYKRVDAAGQDI